jgi:hypothetical protein
MLQFLKEWSRVKAIKNFFGKWTNSRNILVLLITLTGGDGKLRLITITRSPTPGPRMMTTEGNLTKFIYYL